MKQLANQNFDKMLLMVAFLVCAMLIVAFGFYAMSLPANAVSAQIITGLLAGFSGVLGSITTLVVGANKNTKDDDKTQ